MGKGTRRARKQRRRLKMTLNHGHQVRHRLQSGRTGSVHSKRLRSPKKEAPTGEVKVILAHQLIKKAGSGVVVLSNPSEFFNDKPKRVRKKTHVLIPQVLHPLVDDESGPSTAVPMETEAYSLCLRALQYLINIDFADNAPGARLRGYLNKGIEAYEKK